MEPENGSWTVDQGVETENGRGSVNLINYRRNTYLGVS